MKKTLMPFFLRRVKSEVAKQLPEKTQRVVHLDMLPQQAAIYNKSVAAAREKLAASLDAGSSKKPIDSSLIVKRVGANAVKNIFFQLRKISMHPILVRDRYSDSDLDILAGLMHRAGLFGG